MDRRLCLTKGVNESAQLKVVVVPHKAIQVFSRIVHAYDSLNRTLAVTHNLRPFVLLRRTNA